ncbi:MAG TPA: RNA polymerase sigma factor [Acidobacteriota bacterium]|nr:RNA polymerase sigma factor [Acidobacteriota bacterium]
MTQNVREILASILNQNRIRWQRFIAAVLKNEADAEDVVHDAVRRVLVRGKALSSEAQVRMYLQRAIWNVAFERYKGMKRERRRQVPVDEQLLMQADGVSPYDSMEQAERSAERERMLRLMHRGLEHLPSKQFEALRLTILESASSSIRDAGMNNGIPYSTLRHRSKQGLRSLRRFLLSRGKTGSRRQETENRRQNG